MFFAQIAPLLAKTFEKSPANAVIRSCHGRRLENLRINRGGSVIFARWNLKKFGGRVGNWNRNRISYDAYRLTFLASAANVLVSTPIITFQKSRCRELTDPQCGPAHRRWS